MQSKLFISIAFLLVSLSSFSQAGGLACAAAEQIFCGSAYSSATTGTGPDGYLNCGTEGTGGQRWYYFVSPGNGTVTLSLCTGTSYDSRIHVYTGTCGALACAGQNDDSCGLQSQLSWAVTTGTTYYIRVGGFFAGAGAFTATMTCSIPVGGCLQANACNYDPSANFDNGSCDYSCYGCTYAAAANFDATATIDDGSCLFNVVADGCIDPTACNYCNLCATDDGSCDYSCLGCTYSNASNYSASATTDDGSCIFSGCTDPAGINYSPVALVDDGSCYTDWICAGDINGDGIIGVADLMLFVSNFGLGCN